MAPTPAPLQAVPAEEAATEAPIASGDAKFPAVEAEQGEPALAGN